MFFSRFSGSSAPSHELLCILVVLGVGGGTKQRYKMNEPISDAVIQYNYCVHAVENFSQLTMYHGHFYCICQSFKHGDRDGSSIMKKIRILGILLGHTVIQP